MKKYIFAAFSAAMMLSACQQDEALLSADQSKATEPKTISFDLYAQGMKAVTPMSLDELTRSGFYVCAYIPELFVAEQEKNPGILMQNDGVGVQVSFNASTKGWATEKPYYWPETEENRVAFFAYSANLSGQVEFDQSTTTGNYNVFSFEAIPGNEDYIVAYTESAPTLTGVVNLSFRHILSWLKLGVKSSELAALEDGIAINVQNISVLQKDACTYLPVKDEWTVADAEGNQSYLYFQTGNNQISLTKTPEGATTPTDAVREGIEDYMLRPGEVTVSVQYQVVKMGATGDDPEVLYDFTGINAKSVKVNLTQGTNNLVWLDLPTNLQPMSFGLSVSAWMEDTTGTDGELK